MTTCRRACSHSPNNVTLHLIFSPYIGKMGILSDMKYSIVSILMGAAPTENRLHLWKPNASRTFLRTSILATVQPHGTGSLGKVKKKLALGKKYQVKGQELPFMSTHMYQSNERVRMQENILLSQQQLYLCWLLICCCHYVQ